MYLAHFGLREAPFGITPDTSYFFACTDYQEALNTLLVAVRSGEGFIKITGEVGTGKTLLCRQFLASVNGGGTATQKSRFVTAYIPTPCLSPRNLLLALADELKVTLPRQVDQHGLQKALSAALLEFARQDKNVVLCIDEAQAMPLESLETIRLLTNLETEKHKLLQIVLFGQPELDQKLQQNSIRQLNQRITFHYHLRALRRADIDFYLAHRLKVAGFVGHRVFRPWAVYQLYAASGGIPRLINILANKAMMLSYGEGSQQVHARHVRAARRDTVGARPQRWQWLAVAAALVLAGSAWGWMVLR